MDFIHDALADGRSFRTLNLTNSFTRQCLGQEVDTSLSGRRVVRLLDEVAEVYGLPGEIPVDNGPEFRSKALDLWAYQNKVKLCFIEPGKPTQNGHIESFNGRFRAESLDQQWFASLPQARNVIEAWRISDNSQRLSSASSCGPPSAVSFGSTFTFALNRAFKAITFRAGFNDVGTISDAIQQRFAQTSAGEDLRPL